MKSRFSLHQCLQCFLNAEINSWLHLAEESLCSRLSDGKEFLSGLNLAFDKSEAKRHQPRIEINSLAPTGAGMGDEKGWWV